MPLPAKLLEQVLHGVVHGTAKLNALIQQRVIEGQVSRCQQQAWRCQLFGKKAVVDTLAVLGVADDRVAAPGQVAAYLVASPGQGRASTSE